MHSFVWVGASHTRHTMKYSHGFTFKVDTYSNLNTLLDGLNYKTITIGFDKINRTIYTVFW